jgi:uncharacterized membrane protein YbhN (UPF0104 family)
MQTITADIPKKAGSKWIKLAVKVAITMVCIWYISNKINKQELLNTWGSSNGWWVIAAWFAFMISKTLSAFRLNIYFRSLGVQMSEHTNLRLYWLGMFYNLFLPGSIGGDAYKVMRLSRVHHVSYKKMTAAVVLDRFSGLFALVLFTSFLWAAVFEGRFYSVWVLAGAIALIPLSYLAIRKFFPYFTKCYTPTYLWGLLVQMFQMVCMFCILKALHITDISASYSYLLLFMVSSVVAVLPFTVGGLGGREIVFLWGAQLLNLDVQNAIAASLLFYFVTVLASAVGFPFVFADPLQSKDKIPHS